ncbi:MAG: hypothetical protein ACRBHB_17530 [Arenicella sp.]
MGRLVAYLFFGLFAIAGVLAFYGIAIKPFLFWWTQGYWGESPIQLIFGAIFLLSHGGIGLGGLWLVFRSRKENKDLPTESNKPWKGKNYWSSSIITPDLVTYTPTIKKIAAYIAVVSIIVLFAVYESVKRHEYNALYGLIIPVLAYAMYYWSQRLEKRLELFGDMLLSLDPYPASIGGHCGGSVVIKRLDEKLVSSSVKLQNIRHYRSGKNTRQDMLWQQTMVPSWKNVIEGHKLEFCFDLPTKDGLNESQASEQMPYCNWQIVLQATLANGVKIERNYDDIPVFQTAQKSAINNPQAYSAQSHATKALHDLALDKLMPFKAVEDGSYQIHYPMGRNLWGALFAVVGLVFCIAGVMIPELIFNIVFPLLGGLSFLGGLYHLGNSLTVDISPIEINSKRFLFGINVKNQSLPTYALKEFKSKKSHSTKVGAQITQYYNLLAVGKEGQKLVVVENLQGKGQCQTAIERLEKMLGNE